MKLNFYNTKAYVVLKSLKIQAQRNRETTWLSAKQTWNHYTKGKLWTDIM